MATKYLVVIRQNDRVGNEEYEGGSTIEEARKEAAFFTSNTPAHVPVRIVKATKDGGIRTVEVVR